MCAIFGSFNRDKFLELAQLNSYRGQHSYSITVYDPMIRATRVLAKEQGEFSSSTLFTNFIDGMYIIGHIQAPTTDAKSNDYVHPSEIEDSKLWHNGIIKAQCVREMQESLSDNSPWDTELLHKWIRSNKPIGEVDGTFSCLNYDKGALYLFRNEISPMFWDEQLNISSTRFLGSGKTPANTLVEIDFINRKLVKIGSFTTKENPYYFEYGV